MRDREIAADRHRELKREQFSSPARSPTEGSPRLDPLDRRGAGLDGIRILVVEEAEDMREALKLIFRISGADVSAAASLAEAMDSIRCARPQMLVMDLPTPFTEDYELLRKEHLFEENGSPRLIGVALTSPDSPGERLKAIAAGFNVLFEKPVDPLHLLHAVLELSSTPRTATRPPRSPSGRP